MSSVPPVFTDLYQYMLLSISTDTKQLFPETQTICMLSARSLRGATWSLYACPTSYPLHIIK